MALIPTLSLIFLFSFYPEFAQGNDFTDKGKLVTYIVHVNKPEGGLLSHSEDVVTWHQSFLPSSRTASSDSRKNSGAGGSLHVHPRLVYSYSSAISGFAARLTSEEVEAMKTKKGFVSARPQRVLQRHTTHTPTFLGLQQQPGFLKESEFGKGIIIGMLDSGAFPIHPSFGDEGMAPPPAKWKGKCEFNVSSCNNKIIGARTFREGAKANGEILEPPNNDDGHGTHTASTAAGQFVNYADVLGNAKGTAVGIAPRAHLAIYKVCYFDDCPESDMLAGMDAAISDGVDVLSLSIGIDSAPYYQDPIAIGAFAAIQKGIFVSCSAGNSGPFSGSLSNDAPWILTVGASTIDRRISAVAKLGNGEEFSGESLFQPSDFDSTQIPLVYAGNGTSGSEFCGEGSLNESVKGKVVLCERGGGIGRIAKGEEVKRAGGAAMVLANDKTSAFSLDADAHVLPATHVSFDDAQKIKSYINSTTTPTATILFKGTIIGNPLSPQVSSFSSRGPSVQSPGILKPDIVGPGVSIVAAWPFPVDNITTPSGSYFNMMSGTSMSCPHLSGIAALLKSSHPNWSPAVVKSAIMTTAEVMNLGGKPIVDETSEPADLFATGAGHVNPSRANAPGLVYDIDHDDYIPYLCGLGYKDEQVGIIARRKINCSEVSSIPEGELNYPSFSVTLGPSQTFTRTVTNVGEANSTYDVIVTAPEGVHVTISPMKLYFTEENQKATYSVTVSKIGSGPQNFGHAQGDLKWVSAKYSVRSPISVTFP